MPAPLNLALGANTQYWRGGVALNCVANGRLVREGPFENIWFQPASGDAGSALGIALAVENIAGEDGPKRPVTKDGQDAMQGSYLGPAFNEDEIKAALDASGAVYTRYDDEPLLDTVSKALADENVVGWFQGRMEFGPRALGHRSLLALPAAGMKRRLNAVKVREWWRPVAPVLLAEEAPRVFEPSAGGMVSPYMSFAARLRPVAS